MERRAEAIGIPERSLEGSAEESGVPHEDQKSPQAKGDMRRELRKWGVGLLILGVVHFVLAGFLEPAWGVVLVIIGVLNLLITHRGMFIVNGLALLCVGFMNIFSGGLGGWTIFGVFQLYWGVKEICKFGKYAG